MFADAQITLLQTFDEPVFVTANISCSSMVPPVGCYIESPYFYAASSHQDNQTVVNLYNKDDFSLYKSISIDKRFIYISLVSTNILTTDGKVCFCLSNHSGQSCIYNEDGELVTTINAAHPYITNVNGKFLLICCDDYYATSVYIYSLPGNGEATDVNEVSAWHHNARKYLHNDQVLIDSNERTYNLQGQQVKLQ